MKILLLTDGIYPYVMGGMQKHSYNLCKYLARAGVEIILYHCVEQGTKKPEFLHGFSGDELKLIKQQCFCFPKLDNFPGHYLRESYRLSEMYLDAMEKETNIDLIYAQGFTAWTLLKTGKGGQKSGTPVIVNFHGLNMFQKAASVKMKLEQYLLRPAVKYNLKHANFVISLGGKLSEILASIIDKNKIIESPVGIDNDWIEDEIVENEARQLVFIGRNERLKGIKELNKVISRIDDLQFQLHIIGPFNKKDQIVDDRITYHGEIKQEEKVGSILSKMDVLILPSWSEGMPTVILEAMAKGCAIVANDVGAVAELVDDRVGWLCKPGDLNALEMGIRNAIDISDKELSHLKHYAVQKVAQNYTWDKITKRLIDQLKQ
jgi:glycosyltransferase involved in cell wall biosynthesis